MHERNSLPILDPDSLLGMKELWITSDVLGSYTGRMKDFHEIPVQDADDL